MRTLLLAVVVATGCTTASSGPCAEAANHVATCTDETLTYRAEGACEAGRAEALSGMDCKQLVSLADTARADGWWDDFLCQLDFADRCQTETQRTVVGIVTRADGSPAEHVYVRMLSPGNAYAPIHGGWTFDGGVFAVRELTAQTYRLEVALTPTGAALSARTIDGQEPYVAVVAPIP